MKFALVAPTPYQWILNYLSIGYHMVEPYQSILDEHYLTAYQLYGRSGHFIMVDNGAAEINREGNPVVDFDYTLEVANTVRASEIVLPDKLFDSGWTINHTLANASKVPIPNRAVCPQGVDWDDWENCLDVLTGRIEFATLCITKALEFQEGGRAHAMEIVMKKGLHKRMNIHLLGLAINGETIREEITNVAKVYSGIRGLDSGRPIAFAQRGVSVEDHKVPLPLKWDYVEVDKLTESLLSNVTTTMEICNACDI